MAKIKTVKVKSDLTGPQLERLACLGEENGESVQAVGKILRHGYTSYNPDGTVYKSNREQLQDEIGDVLASAIVMVRAGDLDGQAINDRIAVKLQKYEKYLHYDENKQIVRELLANSCRNTLIGNNQNA